MTVNFNLHIVSGISDAELKRYFNTAPVLNEDWVYLFNKVADTPHLFIGEVPWRFALFYDNFAGVPTTILKILDLIGGPTNLKLPKLDINLIDTIVDCIKNHDAIDGELCSADIAHAFLSKYIGQSAFCACW